MLICPSCRKSFATRIVTCPDCGAELLPPSVLELQDRHPELTGKHPVDTRSKERYVDLLHCSPQEVQEISDLLEPEGILCRIEPSEDFRYESQMVGENPVDDPKSLVVRVRSDQLSKARALLDWEAGGNGNEEEPEELTACPYCGAEVSTYDETCPECDALLTEEDEETEEMEAGVYRCPACGAPARPDELTCAACGARLDH